MQTILGFGHASRVGKDFCATQFIEKYRSLYHIERYSIAGLLKQIVFQLGLTHAPAHYDTVPDDRHVKFDCFPKTAIATWTTFGDYLRCYDAYIWARPVVQQIEASTADISIITDIRFPVEVILLQALAVRKPFQLHLIKLVCTDREPLPTKADHALDNHDIWDLVVQQPWGSVDLVWRDVDAYLHEQGVVT